MKTVLYLRIVSKQAVIMAGTIVNFKVYLTKENAPMARTEVRRFGIDSDIVSDFQYLREKLQTIFPNIRGKRFSVGWKG